MAENVRRSSAPSTRNAQAVLKGQRHSLPGENATDASEEIGGPGSRTDRTLSLPEHPPPSSIALRNNFVVSESSDQPGPSTTRQLAAAVEGKLKLAPILARRLVERQTANAEPAGNSSGRNTPQRRLSGSSLNDYSKLPSLLTSIEGRGDRHVKVEGSAKLPQVTVKDQNSPTTSRPGALHSFEEAKLQVDKDLHVFLADVQQLYEAISSREGADVPIVLEVIEKLMDIAEECVETSVEDFRLTVTDQVDHIEEERSACQQRTIRALYTRLLFILTRCSRLLITEQQHLFATEPRNRRRHSQVFGSGFSANTQKALGITVPAQLPGAGSLPVPTHDDDNPVFRSHTMPVKAMYNMVQRLKEERLPQAQARGPENLAHARSNSEYDPESPVTGEKFMLRHHSKSSDLEVPEDGAKGGGAKKKKTFFGKISKGFKNLADGFKRKSSGKFDSPDGLLRPSSENMHAHSVRFTPAVGSGSAASGSAGGSSGSALIGGRVTNSGADLSAASSVIGRNKGPEPQRSVRFVEPHQAPPSPLSQQQQQHHQQHHSLPAGGHGVGGDSDDGGGSAEETGKRAKLMVDTQIGCAPLEYSQEELYGMYDDGQRGSAASSLHSSVGRRRGSVDLYALGLGMGTPLDQLSADGGAPPEELEVVCSICEEAWSSAKLEEHSIHCAVLRTLSSNGLSVDAQMTTIANVLEEWLETPLGFPALGPAPSNYHVKSALLALVKAARNAAALQPDGSKVPATRCFSLQAEISDMLDQASAMHKLAVVTQTYGHRIVRLINDKVNMLAEPFGATGRTRGCGGFSDAGGCGGGDSGTSTPRSLPGMSIEEFEIIKPISRGAFGRVYLARKLATGDYFAIKVMKKRDLIRKNMVESVNNERNILAMAQNPFVVRFYYSFTSKENLYIVMEYINGGDCYSLLRKFGALDETIARQYIAETVLALEYCHAQGIIHRDLKPDNLLINNQGHIKLSDFGLSCVGVIDRTENLNGPQPMDHDGPQDEAESTWSEQHTVFGGASTDAMDSSTDPAIATTSGQHVGAMSAERLIPGGGGGGGGSMTAPSAPGASALGLPPRPLQRTVSGGHTRFVAPEHEARRAVGTPDYLAPELLLGTGHGPEVDWWALGAILYEFITGTPPFNADSPEEIFDNILDRRITWPDEDDMTAECRDVVDKLLHPNPLKRLGHRGAGEVKLHPWFAGLDWTSLVRNKAAFIPAIEDETDTSYFEPKHVSQKSMAEDLEKVRAGGNSGATHSGRTQVERLKDQIHRESSGMRSMGSSTSHASRASYTGGAPALGGPSGGYGPNSQPNASISDSLDGGGASRICSSSGQDFGQHAHHGRISGSSSGVAGMMQQRGSGSGSGVVPGAGGVRASGSGSGRMSERPSPTGLHISSTGGLLAAGEAGGEAGSCLRDTSYVQEEDEDEEDEEAEEDGSPSGDEPVAAGTDPFGNFSFTNYTGLSAANMEKLQKLRQQVNGQKRSFTAPGQP